MYCARRRAIKLAVVLALLVISMIVSTTAASAASKLPVPGRSVTTVSANRDTEHVRTSMTNAITCAWLEFATTKLDDYANAGSFPSSYFNLVANVIAVLGSTPMGQALLSGKLPYRVMIQDTYAYAN